MRFIISLALFLLIPSSEAASPQAWGRYSSGKLLNASIFPQEGKGFVQIFRIRDHFYSTDFLSETIQDIALRMSELYPGKERMQVADLACPKGGKCGGHISHQNGLDVDIIYFRNNMQETIDRFDQNQSMDEDFAWNAKVNKKTVRVVSDNFDLQRNLDFAKNFVETKKVGRIFTDIALKSAFCQWVASENRQEEYKETLSYLRPLINHQNHFHFRLKCPKDSPKCTNDRPIASSSGCEVFYSKKNVKRKHRAGGESNKMEPLDLEAPEILDLIAGQGLDEVDMEHALEETQAEQAIHSSPATLIEP